MSSSHEPPLSSQRSQLPLWLRRSWYVLAPPGLFTCAVVIWQRTLGMWLDGPGLIGWGLWHSSVGLFLLGSMLVLAAWAVVAFLHMLRDRVWSRPWAVMAAGTALCLSMPFWPYGPLEYATVRVLGPGRHGPEILVEAAAEENRPIIELLLRRGIDINAKDDDGNTVIHAAGLGSTTFVAWLIDRGADVNVQNGLGKTPLVEAIADNRADMAELLIRKGADIRATYHGRTMLDFARDRGGMDIARMIENLGR